MFQPVSAAELQALWVSAKVAGVAVLWSAPLALLTAFALARGRFPGKIVLDGLAHMPLVLPPVVIGYLLLVTFGTNAPVGSWLNETLGVRFVFSWTGAALAAGIVSFPFQVRALRLALEAIDPGLAEAAATLGAGPLDRFVSVTLPLAAPGFIAGAITAFAVALGEFGAVITFVSNIPGETRTLPLAIYTALQTPGGEAMAARLVALSIVLAFAGLALSEAATRHARALAGR